MNTAKNEFLIECQGCKKRMIKVLRPGQMKFPRHRVKDKDVFSHCEGGQRIVTQGWRDCGPFRVVARSTLDDGKPDNEGLAKIAEWRAAEKAREAAEKARLIEEYQKWKATAEHAGAGEGGA